MLLAAPDGSPLLVNAGFGLTIQPENEGTCRLTVDGRVYMVKGEVDAFALALDARDFRP